MASYRIKPERPERPHLVDYRDPYGRKRTRSFPTEAGARRFLGQIERELERGEYVDRKAGRVVLAELAREFVDGTTGLRAWTERTNESLLRSRILPTFGAMPIASITTADVKTWVRSMEKEGLSASRIRKATILLRQILQTAVDEHPRRLTANPAIGIKTPAVIAPERLFLTEQQLAELELALDDVEQGAGLVSLLGGYQGLRWGEFSSARRSWIDLRRRKLTIAESNFQRGAKNKRIDTISILPEVAEALERRLRDVRVDPRAFLLGSELAGTPLEYHAFRKRIWNLAVRAAGLPTDLTPHALRHTCASILIEHGWHPKRLQAHLRHSSIRVTMDLYGHLYPEDEEQLWGSVGAAYREARERATAEAAGRRESVVSLDEKRAER